MGLEKFRIFNLAHYSWGAVDSKFGRHGVADWEFELENYKFIINGFSIFLNKNNGTKKLKKFCKDPQSVLDFEKIDIPDFVVV